jgi:hypothetical protein
MLSDYFSGHLAEDKRQTVEEHLAQCATCRQSLATMQVLRAAGDTQSHNDHHPASELLTQFYENRDALDTGTVTEIEQHLQTCDECRQILDFLTDLEQQLRDSVRCESPVPSLSERLKMLLKRPALAFSLTAVLIVAGAGLIYQLSRVPGTAEGPKRVYRLQESLRGDEQITEIERPDLSATVAVQVPYYTTPDDVEYRFVVRDADETRTLPADISADYSQKGVIALEVATASLADGRYTLLLLEIRGAGPPDTTRTRYPFKLRTIH